MADVETDPDELLDLELAELETLSNGVLDLIENGLFDEAERTCLELKARFPDTIDWIERSAVRVPEILSGPVPEILAGLISVRGTSPRLSPRRRRSARGEGEDDRHVANR